MKKSILHFFALCALVVFFLNSCKKEELPTISTSSIAEITAISATGGGSITSDGNAEVTSRGVCWSLEANPSTKDSKTDDGSGTDQFVSNITGLNAGTTYHVRAYATNSVGTAYGADLSFTTLGNVPECITQPASNISPTGVILNGTINANHAVATVTFEYGPTIEYGQTITAGQSPVGGNSITNVSAEIIGLAEGTTYHFRVKAVNSIGSDDGEDMTFTTSGKAPEATTQLPTNITTVAATLNGSVNANYSSTVVTFEYGPTNAYGSTVTAALSPVTGNTSTVISAGLTGLTPGRTYHFRIKAVSSLGTDYGEDMTFTTIGQVPIAITQQASNVEATTSTMNGTVNANHLPTVFSFEYGLTSSYGNTASPASNQVTGSANVVVSINLVGLTGGTTYHYRIVATNQLGTTHGDDVTFTTSSQVPTVTTLDATNTNPTSASLNGSVNANGLPTTVRFEYGTTTSYENTIIATPNPVTGNSIINVSAEIIGLSANTTYYVRAYAINSIGTTYGIGINFKTPFANCGTVTDGDGNIYNTVVTGTQCWIAENLKTTKYNDGSSIPLVTDNTAWYNLIVTHATTTVDPGFCWYNNDMSTYKDSYGALYNVMVARSGRLCPVGWHVPTIDDWAILENDLGGSSEAGGHLKEASLDHWLYPNTGAVNSKGFTALPGGFRDPSGVYDSLGYVGYWWTTTRDFRITDHSRCMYFNDKSVVSQISISNNGFSVRCVKD